MPSPAPTADDVYTRLHDLIIEGVYQPGDRLAHPRLMRELGCGRTPLREALSRLQGDGLAVATPNAGARVAPARLDSAEGMHALRILVEPPLLQARTPAMTAARLRELRGHLADMEAAAHEPNAFQRAHRSFHLAQRATFASPFVDDIVRKTYRHIHRHHQHYRSRPDDPAEWIELDRRTVDALEAGDGLRARQILEFHLIEAALSLVLREDPENRLATLLGAGRANGMLFGTGAHERISLPLAMWWVTPAPGLPAMATTMLHTEPRLRLSTLVNADQEDDR
ncbi:GntR family transcriptional regulator [Capillimicrobium parvum]|uniref:HTH gntR-type domain-containing protein n=1 Tax=Capillimicrobium parvum TaxID=2884022 RepID=A0A9E6XXH4_9ACTN|nr:GntR family transcriptional regulator [Capillimicrobium parvum]UGS35888.1 hypothetical protein DSM104329_02285 [Capillimicrobium parvum]